MKRILSVAMAAAFAGAMSTVQAQSIPTMETCAKYAEADVVFETAEAEAQAHVASSLKADAVAARDAALEAAQAVLTESYLAIYAEGGGMQSDVWDVMVKLLTHQRQLCTKHYGL